MLRAGYEPVSSILRAENLLSRQLEGLVLGHGPLELEVDLVAAEDDNFRQKWNRHLMIKISRAIQNSRNYWNDSRL